jgi:SAM-dependent methyltransferase
MSFDQYADSYEDAIDAAIGVCGGSHAVFTRGKAVRLLELARTVGDPKELTVLDVGCGVGSTDVYLVPEFRRVVGGDVAPAVVEEAARRNGTAEYRLAEEPPALPFDDAEMDIAFASCVFHHVPVEERSALAREMARVVRPGGLVVMFEHNPLNPVTRRVVSRCEFDGDAILLRRSEAEGLLSSAGLQPILRSYLFFWPWDSVRARKIERHLEALPAGAQYVVVAVRPANNGV